MTDRGVTRRDALNGIGIAVGGAALGGPAQTLRAAESAYSCDDALGRDPRALRGGDLPSTFDVAHWLRDGRLRFDKNFVTLAAGCDAREGAFAIEEETEAYDVVVIGGGLSGLSSAFWLSQERPRAKILLLEAAPSLGGAAGRDDAPPLPVPAATGVAYGAAPGAGWLRDFYRALGIDWRAQAIEDPAANYYFDEHTPGVAPGRRGWNIDTLEAGLARVPYDKRIVDDMLRTRTAIMALGADGAGLSDPPDQSDPKHDHLSTISLKHYLENDLRCDPAVTDFYSIYTASALGGAAHQVNAHSALSFLTGEFARRALFTFPGGMSELARRIQKRLNARIETRAAALRIDVDAVTRDASVVYFQNGKFRRVSARKIIVAAPPQVARHLAAHLFDDARRRAWSTFDAAPLVTANVALRRAAPLLELGLGYSQSWWGGRHFVNFIVADWVSDRRAIAERQTVLTFYGGCEAPPEDLAAERARLLRTPFADYEESLRSDLARLLRGANFDFDRDVSAICLYRWGHNMLRPPPNWLFGATRDASGRLERENAPRKIAGAPLGPILFAGQHTEGTPSIESAFGSGRRAALQILDDL